MYVAFFKIGTSVYKWLYYAKYLSSSKVYPTRPSCAGCDTTLISKQNFWLEFKVFLLLDWLPYQGLRTKSPLLFTHSWRGNLWVLPRTLAWSKRQTALFRFWTRVTNFISYGDNRYTMHAFRKVPVRQLLLFYIFINRYNHLHTVNIHLIYIYIYFTNSSTRAGYYTR